MDRCSTEISKKIINYAYAPVYCVLQDCNRENCHNCFPVIDCTEHKLCIEEGQFIEFSEYILNKKKYDKKIINESSKKQKIKN